MVFLKVIKAQFLEMLILKCNDFIFRENYEAYSLEKKRIRRKVKLLKLKHQNIAICVFQNI